MSELEKLRLSQRFWSKVNVRTIRRCWEWMGAKSDSGTTYGQFWWRGRIAQAHRVSYMLNVGRIPKGMLVIHKCDNKGCVNPAHLIVGTQAFNIQDAVKKKRLVQQKLTVSSVREIRLLRNTGIPTKFIASAFGVCQAHVRKVANKTAWSHV